MDNYLESYHVPIGHPGLYRMFTPDYEDQRGVPGVARGISWMRERPPSRWSERVYQKYRRPGDRAASARAELRRSWRFYSCLPNLGIDICPSRWTSFRSCRAVPASASIRGAAFGLPMIDARCFSSAGFGNRINMQVNREDRSLCERLQRGLADSAYRPGPLSQLETWMMEFHDLLRTRIPEANLPAAPARFA